MRTFNQKGFTPILLVVIVAVVAVGGFVVWRVYGQPKSVQSQQIQNTQTQPQPKDPNAGYVVIKEWGVRFKPVEGLVGAEYFKVKGFGDDTIGITSSVLATKEPHCSKEAGTSPIKFLNRSKEIDQWAGGVVAQIGDYYYQSRVGGAACSENSENFLLESKISTAISQSLSSLEVAK